MRFDIRHVASTTSTNDDAKAAADKGAAEGTVVWADAQTAGKGRQGRTWQSPKGNLYFSVLLRPTQPLRTWGAYSFIAGLAVSDVVQALTPRAKVELKWPNDVLVNDKKISGVLLESGKGWLVMGIGLNVIEVPQAPLFPATSLRAEGAAPVGIEVLLNKILEAIDGWCTRMKEEDFAPVRAAWLVRAKKGPMRVRLPTGGEIQGSFADLDAEGNLHLLLPDGELRHVNTGDVFF